MKIAVIPDTQVKKDVPTDHLEAYGNYIVDKKPDIIVHLGDHFDMPSLSQYEEKGSRITEGARYVDDIASGRAAMERLLSPIVAYNNRRKKHKKTLWKPRIEFLLGNHEFRVIRAVDKDPMHYEGVISIDDMALESYGWNVNSFLSILEIEQVMFSHYFQNPQSLRKGVVGGSMEAKLKNLGKSFVMGHQQLLQYGLMYRPDGTSTQGLVIGAFYQHNEGYMQAQGNLSHWRGAAFLHDVNHGNYDLMTLSLDYLLREWL